MTTWQTRVGDGPHLTVAHPARQDMCQVTLYFKPTILIHVRRHVSIYVCFYFCTLSPTGAVGNHRRGCLLKEDMSAGDNPNCCSGRLSIGNLQGHTPWVFFLGPITCFVETDCVIQETHIGHSSQIFASCSCWRTRLFETTHGVCVHERMQVCASARACV